MELRALELGWIKGREDDPADQCAHGKILFQVGNIIFVRPEDGIWTVSAAGLFLLRTLEHDHTAENPVSEFNFLIPHCGNDAWKNKGSRFNVVCMGCNQGRNPEVIHRHNKILVRTEQEQSVSFQDWKESVFAFADEVRGFYDESSPEVVPDPEALREGWTAFWQEWRSRREATYS